MIEHVGVVGAGTMGVGVSQAFAAGGLRVTLVDVTKSVLDTARTRIGLDARMATMFGGPAADAVVDRIAFTTDLTRLAEILGALHYLRDLCGAREGQTWRNEMLSWDERIRRNNPAAVKPKAPQAGARS